ncbi:hypothetical protein BH10BAC5_BH10BAC5_19000 [soil metagenome]
MFVLVQGCGLFDTRDVETPTGPRSNFIPPTSPSIVIDNFISAISQKDINNYSNCLSDTSNSGRRFVFIPDVQSQSNYPVFNSWDRNKETGYFTNLVNQTSLESPSNLFLSNVTSTLSNDSAVYNADYLFLFTHNRTNLTKTARGSLRFNIRVDGRNLWSINSWSDFKSQASDTTWSVVKANFVN